MPRVDFRVASAGVKPDTKVLLTSQGSDVGTTTGDLFNQANVLKFHDGTSSKTIAFIDSTLTGTWNGSTIAVNRGGTGLSAYVAGDIIYANGTTSLTTLAKGTGNQILGMNSGATAPEYKTISGTTDQVTVTHGAGTITLALPQSINTTSSPTFTGTTLTGTLNANGGAIATTQTTFNLVNATATTVNLAGAATTLTLGAGTATTINLRATTLVSNQATVALLNTTSTTVNFAGAATTVNIGASTGSTTVNNNLVVGGNLTVNGTTTTVNSTVTTLDDPVITLGGDTAPVADDNKDRGVEFRWHNGTAARVGFFGLSDATGKFTFIPEATNTAEVFSGTKGTIDVGSVETGTLFVGNVQIDTASSGTNQVLAYNGTKYVPTTFVAGGNSFTTIAVSGQTSVEADSTTDTLTLAAGTGITLTTNATTDTITVTNSGVTSLTGTANQITVSASTGGVTLSLPATINVNTTGTAASWTTARTITLGGDLTGNVSIDGTANVTLNATVAANSVALGTDTTGDYLATLTQGTGVTITGATGEGSSPTIAIGQSVATSATVSFSQVNVNDGGANVAAEGFDSATLTSVTPTAVKTVSSTLYRSVKYQVQVTQGANYMVTEILAVHNGTAVTFTEYGTIVIGTQPATFDVDITGGNIRLMATSASSSSTVYRVRSTALAI
jgi:hypothetical protein